MKAALALVIAVTACSDGNKKPPDAAPLLVMGEIVDFDSTDTGFCGIFRATFTVRGAPAITDSTNPNGRFMLNISFGKDPVLVDITPPTAGSECLAGMPTYSMPGVMVIDPMIAAAAQEISARDFTTMRQATLGVTLDPAKGHVFVHVDGAQPSISVSTGSDLTIAWNGATWAAGSTGINVFFANVPAGTTDVTTAGTVPVEAGKITYVTIVGS